MPYIQNCYSRRDKFCYLGRKFWHFNDNFFSFDRKCLCQWHSEMLGTCNTRATARQTVNVHVCTNKKKVNKSAPQMRYGQGVLRQAGECWGFVFKKMLSSACIDVNVARSSVKFEEFRNDRNQPRMIYDDRGAFIWSRIPGSELRVSKNPNLKYM